MLFSLLQEFRPWAWLAIGVAVAFIGFCYVIMPVLLKGKMRHTMRPDFEPFDPDRQDLPAKIRGFFDGVTSELSGAGFAVAGYLFHVSRIFGPDDDTQTHVHSLIAVMENPATQESAMAMVNYAQSRAETVPKITESSVILTTRFGDGGRVATTDSSTLSAFAPQPDVTAAWLPRTVGLARLLRVHRHLTERFGGRAKVSRPAEEDLTSSILRDWTETLAHQAELGYFWHDEEGGVYRPTWKGAVLMTWKLLWPWSSIQRVLRKRQARRLLREVGV
jgi:hypothetical protein